jgi:hypothetical protein
MTQTHPGSPVPGQPEPIRIPRPGAPLNGQNGRYGQRTSVGTATAMKAVAEDASALVRAEIALAKAELMDAVKAKATGAGMFAAAGALVAVAGLGLLITIGLALALVMPGWAAALTVSGALLLIAAILVLVGRAKLRTPVSIETTKQNVEEDVAWTKAHLGR